MPDTTKSFGSTSARSFFFLRTGFAATVFGFGVAMVFGFGVAMVFGFGVAMVFGFGVAIVFFCGVAIVLGFVVGMTFGFGVGIDSSGAEVASSPPPDPLPMGGGAFARSPD